MNAQQTKDLPSGAGITDASLNAARRLLDQYHLHTHPHENIYPVSFKGHMNARRYDWEHFKAAGFDYVLAAGWEGVYCEWPQEQFAPSLTGGEVAGHAVAGEPRRTGSSYTERDGP